MWALLRTRRFELEKSISYHCHPSVTSKISIIQCSGWGIIKQKTQILFYRQWDRRIRKNIEPLLRERTDPNGVPLAFMSQNAICLLRFGLVFGYKTFLPSDEWYYGREILLKTTGRQQIFSLTEEEIEDRFAAGTPSFWSEVFNRRFGPV